VHVVARLPSAAALAADGAELNATEWLAGAELNGTEWLSDAAGAPDGAGGATNDADGAAEGACTPGEDRGEPMRIVPQRGSSPATVSATAVTSVAASTSAFAFASAAPAFATTAASASAFGFALSFLSAFAVCSLTTPFPPTLTATMGRE